MKSLKCSKCNSSNLPDAVVCIRCGARLERKKPHTAEKLWKAGILQSILTAPWKLVRWSLRTVWGTVQLCLILLLTAATILGILAFAPFNLPEMPFPQTATEKDLHDDLRVLLRKGGIMELELQRIIQLGNYLIFAPQSQYMRHTRKDKKIPGPDGNTGYFSMRMQDSNTIIFAFVWKYKDKHPILLSAIFRQPATANAIMKLQGFRLGQLQIPEELFTWIALRRLRRWNRHERFTEVLQRVVAMRHLEDEPPADEKPQDMLEIAEKVKKALLDNSEKKDVFLLKINPPDAMRLR